MFYLQNELERTISRTSLNWINYYFCIGRDNLCSLLR